MGHRYWFVIGWVILLFVTHFYQEELLEGFSFVAVIDVLTKFYGAKETQSNQLERLEKLSLRTLQARDNNTDPLTMSSFQQYRDRFTKLSAHVSDGQLTALGRCSLVLRKLPESLRLALIMNHVVTTLVYLSRIYDT